MVKKWWRKIDGEDLMVIVNLDFVTSELGGCRNFGPVVPLVRIVAPPQDRAHKIRHTVLQPNAQSRGAKRLQGQMHKQRAVGNIYNRYISNRQ